MRISYSKDRDIFYAISQYSEKDTLKFASFMWNPAWKQWETVKPEIAQNLLQYCDPTAVQALQQKQSLHVEKINESKKVNTDFVVPCPEGLSYYPFQRSGVEFISKRGNVLLADEMGLGKTISTIGWINTSQPKTVLVICPAIMKLVWKQELKRWLTSSYEIQVLYGRGSDQVGNFAQKRIIIVNYDVVKDYFPQLEKLAIDLIVLDESHFIKNWKAQRSQHAVKLCWKAHQKLLLTGTPIMNRPAELFNQLKALNHPLAQNYWKFAEQYLDTDNYGRVLGTKNLEKLQEQLRTSCMLRRTKDEVLTELPPKTRQVITLNLLTDNERKEQERLLNQYLSDLKSFDSKFVENAQALRYKRIEDLGEIARARHDTAMKKVPQVIEHMKNILEENSKVVVFCHHKDVVDAIVNEFSSQAVRITGEESNDVKVHSVQQFQENEKVHVAVVSIRAAGVGITLNKASVGIFAEIDWTPSANFQAEDRLHRIGQTSKVLIQYMVIDGSIDAWIVNQLVAKQQVIEQVVEIENVQQQRLDTSNAGTEISVPKINSPIAQQISNASPREVLERTLVKQAFGILAGFDPDRAFERNDIGFNKIDNDIGHSFAEQKFPLTPRQVEVGKKILRKYQRQIPPDLYRQIFFSEVMAY